MNTANRHRFVSDGVAAMSNERILVALYDRLLADLDGAVTAIAAREVAQTHEKLVHAQRIVEELLLALDSGTWPGATDLAALYVHARNLLVTANLRKDAAPVAECRTVIEPLADAWKAAYAQTTTPALTLSSPVPAGANSWGA